MALWRNKQMERKHKEEKNLDQVVEFLTRNMNVPLKSCSPRTRICKRSRRRQIEKIVEKGKEVRKIIRNHKKSRRDSRREALKKKISELRRQIKKSRKMCWNRFQERATEVVTKDSQQWAVKIEWIVLNKDMIFHQYFLQVVLVVL